MPLLNPLWLVCNIWYNNIISGTIKKYIDMYDDHGVGLNMPAGFDVLSLDDHGKGFMVRCSECLFFVLN